jgi:methanogenic corrinoid protein MtbC1
MMDVSSESNEVLADNGRGLDAEFRVDPSTFNVAVEDIDERTTKLVDVVAKSVIPELLAKFEDNFALPNPSTVHAGEAEILRLAAIILGPDDVETVTYLESLRERGLSLDVLHQDLLEPTARHLGDLWNQDHLDFLDVTIGVARLQRMVHYFARLDQIPPYDEMRRVLVVQTPGELHSFGITVIRRFLTAGGWNVRTDAHMSAEQIEEAVANEWFGVAGFSLAGETHIEQLADVIAHVRKASRNPNIGIMVGGPAFVANPNLVGQVGADGMATNGPTAVILAKKLLASSLVPSI